jgi:hypothetical protein
MFDSPHAAPRALLLRALPVALGLMLTLSASPTQGSEAVLSGVSHQLRRDSLTVTIAPIKRIEVKLEMKKGQKADFEWRTDGAEVSYNLHAEVPSDPSIRAHVYSRGASTGEKGSVVAVFDGVHGWAWRNTSDKPVTVTVKASGQFAALKTMR